MVSSEMRIMFGFVFLLQYVLGASIPSQVHIGGLFSPASPDGIRSLAQAEHLAAFVMAIDEINNKNDGVLDNVLPNTNLTFAVQGGNDMGTSVSGFLNLESSFNGEGVFAVVSAQENENALIVNQVATQRKVPVLLTVANSGQFSDGASFPYTAETVALESFEAYVLAELLCTYFEISKVLLFFSTAPDDIDLIDTFLQAPVTCPLTILDQISVRSAQSDFSAELAQAQESGARYFVVFLPPSQTAALLEQGYASGVFHDYTVILTPDRASTNVTTYFSPDADIPTIMTGFFTLKYLPDYYMNKTTEAMDFARRWKARPSTTGTSVSGGCSSAMDDAKSFHLYNSTKGNHCLGLDFSSYSSTGLDIQPFTALTYDATILLALALDFALTNALDYTDPLVIKDILTNNVTGVNGYTSYMGVSGPIALYPGVPGTNRVGSGQRIAGNQYEVINFNPTEYARDPTHVYVKIGSYSGDTSKYYPCEPVDEVECFLPVFSESGDNDDHAIPSDTPPAIYKELSYASQMVLMVLACVIAFLVLCFAAFVAVFRKAKDIKASQPELLYCILFGLFIAALRMFIAGVTKSDRVCISLVWFGHLSFAVVVGGLYVKAYRVHCIVNTKTIHKVTFTAFYAVKMLAFIAAAMMGYLAILVAFGEPHQHWQRQWYENQETVWNYCTLVRPEYQTALYAVEAVMLVFSFRVCWEIRNVPDIVNESKQIAIAMATIVGVSVLILPIVSFLGLDPYPAELIGSLGFGFGALVTLLLIFVPKVTKHYRSFATAAKVGASPGSSYKDLSGKQDGKDKKDGHGGCPDAPRIISDVNELMKARSREERLIFCQQQLAAWQTMLLSEQRSAFDHSSSNPESNDINSPAALSTGGGGVATASSFEQESKQQQDGANTSGGSGGAVIDLGASSSPRPLFSKKEHPVPDV